MKELDSLTNIQLNDEDMKDTRTLDLVNYIYSLKGADKEVRKSRRGTRILNAVLLFLMVAISAASTYAVVSLNTGHENALREQRQGLYTLNQALIRNAPAYTERMERFCKAAKAVILDTYDAFPVKRMSDADINRFVLAIFKYSEQYMVDPWRAMAFARAESQFSPQAVSAGAGARGIFQLMPGTARALLGEEYFDGCEFVIEYATKAFFKYYLWLAGVFGDDLSWIAAGYVAGSQLPYSFYIRGASYSEYESWFAGVDPRHYLYPRTVESLFKAYKDL